MNVEYADARLRELSDSWVRVQGGTLVGYLWVDPEQGFRLRICTKPRLAQNGQVLVSGSEPGEVVDVGYEQLKEFKLEKLTPAECRYLSLPDLRLGRDSERLCCRRIVRLDHLRLAGHPDVVRVQVVANLPVERVRVRLDREAFEKVYEGTLLDQPRSGRFSVGETITIVEFMWRGALDLFWPGDAWDCDEERNSSDARNS